MIKQAVGSVTYFRTEPVQKKYMELNPGMDSKWLRERLRVGDIQFNYSEPHK
jgi:hypothetical protein